MPVIGVTVDHTRDRTRYELSYDCVRAVVAGGGVPLLIPFDAGIDPAAVLGRVDGLLLSGGNDPDPAAWGEDWHPSCVPVDPTRETFERRLIAAAEARRTPTLGVCFGMQLMCITRGGSLHQFLPDLPDRDEHRRTGDDWTKRHDVAAAGLLGSIVGETCRVNTSHRQAVRAAGRGMAVCGTALDGTVEAVADEKLPFWLGVQWHPERMPGEPAGWPLVAALVDAARGATTSL